MKKHLLRFAVIGLGLASLAAAGQQLDVPFVPTPREVVEAMLSLADVKKGDVLYDLGCGDGRIVIMAAEKFGVKGVGVDLNPQRVKESRENAAAAGVENLVTFIEGNIFDVEVKDASVVTLYLLSSVNLRLRPRLFRELRPGTRVVSHDFSMDDWKPDKFQTVNGGYDNHYVYFWVIPANISGVWDWAEKTASGERRYVLDVTQRFQHFYGTLKADGLEEVPLSDVELSGDQVKFSARLPVLGGVEVHRFEGRARGDTLEGAVSVEGSARANRAAWKAVRRLGTARPIDE